MTKQTNRGYEIYLELSNADLNHELLRCIAESIAHLEKRFDDSLNERQKLLFPKFKFYGKEQK